MKIVDVNLANTQEAMEQIKNVLESAEFAGKETRLYITKHNKTFRGQPTKTEYTAPATTPEPAKAPAKKSHHNKTKGY